MLAYVTVLGLRDGHLVYARGDTEPIRHDVRHDGITLHRHALDLAVAPEALLTRVDDLVAEVASVPPLP